MPRKYDKKTKANFRAGRRNSRRLSMRVNMVSPVLSMFDEFDPAIEDTLLSLKARGIDRERERFAEALTEVRDRISKASKLGHFYTFEAYLSTEFEIRVQPIRLPLFWGHCGLLNLYKLR